MDGGSGFLHVPASRYLVSSLVLLFLAIPALGATIGGPYALVTGDAPGGRRAGLVLLVAGVAGALTVVIFRRSGRMWHVLLGVLVIVPVGWVDTWVNDPVPRFRLSSVPVVLAIWIAVHWGLHVRRRRGRDAAVAVADVAGPSAPHAR